MSRRTPERTAGPGAATVTAVSTVLRGPLPRDFKFLAVVPKTIGNGMADGCDRRRRREGTGSVMERRIEEEGSLLAEGLSSNGNPPQVYATGRVCIEPGCGVRLSRYNSTEWCALHESPLSTDRPFDPSTRPRGRRRNSAGRRGTRSRRHAA